MIPKTTKEVYKETNSNLYIHVGDKEKADGETKKEDKEIGRIVKNKEQDDCESTSTEFTDFGKIVLPTCALNG